MHKHSDNIISYENTSATTESSKYNEDFAIILKSFDLKFKSDEYYLLVGDIKQVQGWIIHVSVIISQFENLLNTVIPLLVREKVPFKIPSSREICKNIQFGHFGVIKIGKTLCIYPETDAKALSISKELIKLTHSFKGPVIPTDICLGNVVYTRYGSFNPIILSDINGKEDKYIYDLEGKLIKDIYKFPFTVPKNISWPFNELTPPLTPNHKKTLKDTYRLITILKEDIKGFVYKGIYFKKLFKVSKCVLKQGRKHMSSDEDGRDLHDKLVWQYEIYQDLKGSIPTPNILDFFQEDGDTYLVMEFIEGQTLHSARKKNFGSINWLQTEKDVKQKFIGYLLAICKIIEILHEKGYVHRDIAPGNFIIDKRENIYLIDLELTYSFRKNKPEPPFIFGTAGFMSPEQQAILTPTIKEDIYGFGALMIFMLTGLNPIKFDIKNDENLFNNLYFFIGNTKITQLICRCLSLNLEFRPTLEEIKEVLINFGKETLNNTNPSFQSNPYSIVNSQELAETITSALKGLSTPPTIIGDDFWYSKSKNDDSTPSIENKLYKKYPGIYIGAGGILYCLSRMTQIGLNIDFNQKQYINALDYIENRCNDSAYRLNPGFYEGTSGVALALCQSIEANLIENNEQNRKMIIDCLQTNTNELSLANGVTGIGIASLQCRSLIEQETINKILTRCVDILLKTQQKDGSWNLYLHQNRKTLKDISFGYGMSGIIYFLLEYSVYHENNEIKKAALRGLDWILKTIRHEKSKDKKIGITLTTIKAYEALQLEFYKNISEEILHSYPTYLTRNDFTQSTGLAGLGELFLEASRVLKNNEWSNRAGWIANIYLHSFIRNINGSGYWMIDEHNYPTADLMVGSSGIIHFLARYLYPDKLGHILLR